ncbi:hypothetical protein [Microbacterium proteolyticum]|jgi:hypothetical protein|uniref:hypothetical protein n=1 Tax=Microbacterium proteolyticum TaxID=1572644 RepID=UPI001FAE0BF2|nr:hypothetical protein [Microbacterium proteolyticum]MCI9859226.1 hypothetical protein [Microbacterium proteolyticum]
MAIALSAAVLLIGSTLLLGSVLVVTTSVPGEPFPVWSNPTRHRGASIGLRMAGVALIVFSSTWGLGPVGGAWVAVPVALAFGPGALAILLHNRSLPDRAAGERSGA